MTWIFYLCRYGNPRDCANSFIQSAHLRCIRPLFRNSRYDRGQDPRLLFFLNLRAKPRCVRIYKARKILPRTIST
ncbi:hypothetical protein BKA67DRAFT_583439 [Truncatella angustata]|uniref:Uncharacterized protein n=1 Tax=Truncatella angustata TaxID=152316 RepID=A0A9P8RMK4_9PEZI|nr:uncharacterized protein BKA67DRAFT_583439 [Truncatella angustata]KAH6646170.1 hypothetical protein BKA67DRAFT_583439 [Truncatella angustata]